MRFTHFPPHLIYVTTLPCKTQMFQIVTASIGLGLLGSLHHILAYIPLYYIVCILEWLLLLLSFLITVNDGSNLQQHTLLTINSHRSSSIYWHSHVYVIDALRAAGSHVHVIPASRSSALAQQKTDSYSGLFVLSHSGNRLCFQTIRLHEEKSHHTGWVHLYSTWRAMCAESRMDGS